MHCTLLCCSEAFHNSKLLRSELLSFKFSKYIMIISMIDEVYRCTVVVKVIRFSRIRWSITSLRLERIIPCEIPHLVVSYRFCDQFYMTVWQCSLFDILRRKNWTKNSRWIVIMWLKSENWKAIWYVLTKETHDWMFYAQYVTVL